ncbi:receptor-like protein 56 isoform X2 [Hevea brasiliensis]|uniref:receptor-like protein 56 isoform X2 n=1 Tax=Hevea brasiliensis TaxID=3981 RepID=UPI0025E828F6|nr:receptor-like protein 56 isoform X2 [Hevea brasiliensis]
MERILLKFSLWFLILLVQMNAYSACLEKERIGLMEFKAFLKSNCYDNNDILDSWVDDGMSDCCDWEGVICNATSRRVIELSVAHMGYGAFENGTFGNETFCSLNLSLLHPFEALLRLDLSSNRLNGWINKEGFERLSRLKKLQCLDLSDNLFNNSILSSVNALISLKTLILRGNNMAGLFRIKGFDRSSSLKKLQVLDLSSNMFNNSILPHMSGLVSLKTLILRSNDMAGSFPSKVNLKTLETLDISYNQFNGTQSVEGLCGLKSLTELGLRSNQFSGPLPQCLGNLTNLQVLDLSTNQFSGNIQSVVSKLTSLKYLFLSGNEFEGLFSFSTLANHSKLEIFQLSSGSSRLKLETEHPTWFPTFQLKLIDLPNCNLNLQTKTFPSFLLYQHDIRFIDLSHNKLVGTFPSWILQNNSKLEIMNLMNNAFKGTFQLPNFKHGLRKFEISSNNITGQLAKEFGLVFPNLSYINMSRNSFYGNIPSSIGEMQGLKLLDMSNNNFSRELPGSLFVNCTNIVVLILSNNNFQGNIFPNNMNLRSLMVLDMNNNNFTGMISAELGKIPMLQVLDISNNKVSGTIPMQLCNLSNLDILDLSQNILFGSVPSCFNASSLRFLFLQKNGLNGLIPPVLARSPNLVALDLRDNKFSGSIPSWISQLSKLLVLSLGGNALRGHIPNQLCQLRNVRIMDLSRNFFFGSIPSCFNNVSFGMMGEDNFETGSISEVEATESRHVGMQDFSFSRPYSPYNSTLELDLPVLSWSSSKEVEVEIAMKYRYNSYKGYIINLVAGIDLSCNELTGSIPPEIGDLHEIQSLNLSHNYLTGSIPVSFANLKSLESLDLGNNNLSGEIPRQLVELNFLGTFDVSYNNLSGRVLDKGQFGTFDESSYRGNPGLCGPFIHRSCNADESPATSPLIDVEEQDTEGGIDMVWFYWSFCASYVTILLVLVAILCINRHWRMLWFYFIDGCIYSISVWLFETEFYQ